MLRRFNTLPIKVRFALGVVVLPFLAYGATAGCSAYQRPPDLTSQEQALLAAGPLPYSVAVMWWDSETEMPGARSEVYSGPLARLLSASGAFEAIRYERMHPRGDDLVATSTGDYCNSAAVPVWTVLSLGLIPAVWQEEHCEGMLLRLEEGRPKTEGVEIRVSYRGTAVLGWAAVVVGFLPGWSHGSIEHDRRFAERFTVEIVKRQDAIRQLLGR